VWIWASPRSPTCSCPPLISIGTLAIQDALAGAGESVFDLLPEAYALVREASRRTTGLVRYDVQLLGGIALLYGSIAEMDTGEGKTLTATLPLYLRALCGKWAQLATVNDYLARRDAEFCQPIYELPG